MELKIFNLDGTEKGKIKMPALFEEPVRKDIIKRAVEAILANRRQPYGAKREAGMRASAKLSRQRHDYKGSYGHGISRVPRKTLSSRGTRFNWVAAFAPGVVGGRRAHPPKSSKIYDQKINKKENRLAIRSALAASLKKEIVSERGHKIPQNYPFVVDESIENVEKTKQLIEILTKLGFGEELARTQNKKIRAGAGKLRGRKYITKKGLLIITANNSKIKKACSNIPGFESVSVNNLNVNLLAPGTVAGRMILLTKSAVEKISKENLFSEKNLEVKEKVKTKEK